MPDRKSKYVVWTALLMFVFVAYGLGRLVLPFESGVVWALAHDAGSIPILVAVVLAGLLLPVAAAAFAARVTYAWIAEGAEAPSRFSRPELTWIVAIVCLISTVGIVAGIRDWLRGPHRIQNELVFAKGQYMPTNPVLVGGRVYWINNRGVLMTKAKSNKDAVRLSPVRSYTNDLYSDQDALYWVEDLKLIQFRLPSGPRMEFTDAAEVSALAFDSRYVYWTRSGIGHSNYGTEPNVFRVDRAGGPSTGVAPGVDLPCCTGERPSGLAADNTFLFWTESTTGSVFRVKKEGGKRELVASEQKNAQAILIEENTLFWTTLGTFGGDNFQHDGTVVRAAADGTEATVLMSGLHEPTYLAIDSAYVYVACPDRILKAAKSGGTPTTVVDQQFNIRGLQVDDESIYWSDARGAVYRVKK
jgi:hypothetical protein